MGCDNCNFTDGKCCHESIRRLTQVDGDESDIEREFEHVLMKRANGNKQKENPISGH